MKYLVVLSLVAAASAAKLDKVYLPPNAGASSGASVGLQAPFGSTGAAAQYTSPGQSSSSSSSSSQAEILRYENEMNENGYHYAYETSDGTKAEQDGNKPLLLGRVLPGATPEDGSLQVSGSYSYIGDDGQTYSITYTADENGFKPQGAHLPTPPPIPEAILKSLQLTAGTGAHYDSQKSSYDADNGY